MTTSELPPTEIPTKPLDETTLTFHLGAAMGAARDALSQFEPNSQQLEIIRPNQTGFGTVYLEGPDYGRTIWREAPNLCRLPESLALADYLWDCGSERMSITRGDGRPAERPAWDRAIWGQLIHGPLQWLLYGAALEDLVLSGEYPRWHLPSIARDAACADIAQQRVRKQQPLVAECLIGAALPSADEYELEPGILLKQLTTEEQCIHFTKFEREYSADDIQSMFHPARLRVTQTVNDLRFGAGGREIAESIDRAKWALSIGNDGRAVFHEGPVIIRGLAGFRGPTLRRQDSGLRSGVVPTTNLSREGLGRAQESLRALREVANAEGARRLRNAIWLFGRACTAALARDALLDSVVGLDSLLAPGGGESKYRVALHGTALLSTDDPEATFGRLKEMYDLRSGAAHSADPSKDRYDTLAPIALGYLAGVISAVVRLVNAQAIVLDSKGSIAHGVEGWVRKLLFSHASTSNRTTG
jgi:hypothetical protein